MDNKLFALLKTAAGATALLAFFPLFVMLDGLILGYAAPGTAISEADCWRQNLLLLACGAVGYGAYFGLGRIKKLPLPAVRVLTATVGLAAGAGVYFLCGGMAAPLRWVAAVLSLAGFFLGACMVRRRYSAIFPKYMFPLTIGLNPVSMAVLWFFHLIDGIPTAPAAMYVPAFLVTTAVYGVVRNQSNLDSMMQRRKHKLEFLPQKSRLFSAALLLVVFALVLIGYFNRHALAQGAWAVADAFGWLVGRISDGVMWLARQLSQRDNQPMDPIETEPDSSALEVMEEPASQGGNYFFIVVVVLVVLFLIIRYRGAILEFLRNLWQNITKLVKRLLFVRKAPAVPAGDGNNQYIDQEESISYAAAQARKEEEQQQKRETDTARRWKKQYKQFLKMEDSPQKLRYGYALSLQWLKMHGAEPARSATPIEILHASQKTVGTPEFAPATDGYNAVRYGEEAYSPQEMEGLVKTLEALASRRA